jgi:hypothetical protein
LSILHYKSSAVEVIKKCSADQYLVSYEDGDDTKILIKKLYSKLIDFQKPIEWSANLTPLQEFSASSSARILANAMDNAINNN